MEPEEFVRKILVGQMNARMIVVGTDCSFGYRGAGQCETFGTFEKTVWLRVDCDSKRAGRAA